MPQPTARVATRVRMTRTFTDLLKEVHDAHYTSLFRYFDRLSGDPDLAADVVQEAFVRLYRRGSLPDRPDRWLVTVALNLFRNERSTARRRGVLRLEHGADLSPAGQPTPVDSVEDLEQQARVRAALDGLSRRERELLLLRAEGYAYRDLATILELNEASVGTLLARAKQAFRANWEER